MFKIEKSALHVSNLAGGARKQSKTVVEVPGCPCSPTSTPTATTGSATSSVMINGKEIISQSVTF
jgi:Ni,Fe-hydrogenase I small subunit